MIRYLSRILLEIIWIDWVYVGYFRMSDIDIQHSYRTSHYEVIIHCYESRWGSRRCKIKILRAYAINLFHTKKIKNRVQYQTEIYPWLKGRYCSDIPTYDDLKQNKKWDFTQTLKNGKTNLFRLNKDKK